MLDRFLNRIEQLSADRPVLLAFVVAVILALVIVMASLPFYLDEPEAFSRNLASEAWGPIFGMLVMGWLLLWLNKLAEHRRQKTRYREEIKDILGWQSPEAAHRIARNIRRLNRVGVTHGISLVNAYLREASLEGVRLIEADLWGGNLEAAKLRAADLTEAKIAGANFEVADMESTDLCRADIRGTNLRATDLERANLEGANMGGADLTDADLQYAVLKRANMERASLNGTNLRGTDLEGANLEGADLNEANLMDATLRQVNLQNASLRKANLTRVDLQLADLGGANLERANLRGIQLPQGDDLSVFENVATLFGAQFDSDVEIELKRLYPHLFEQPQDWETAPIEDE